MGISGEKYTREYFTGVDKDGIPVGYGTLQEKDDEGLWVLRGHDRRILEVLDFKDKNVLDLGCGRGEAICYAYQNSAIHCVGVDFSEAAISLAAELIVKRNLPEARLINLDALTFISNYIENSKNLKQPQFDIVLMLDFVEHIPRNELKNILEGLKKIINSAAIIVINTPVYKYDNDVIRCGYDERNWVDCFDISDNIPETKGMHCNKYTVISLQDFMIQCGFMNISEDHFYVDELLFDKNIDTIELLAYSERWRLAKEQKVPLRTEYIDDISEYPYKISEIPSYVIFEHGNMSGLTLLLTKTYMDMAFPGGNYDAELFSSINREEIENKVIFEVGAFMGANSLIFAKLSSPNGRVIAFEPNPWNRNRLFLNLSHNQNLAQRILVYDYALGELNEKTPMTMSTEIDNGYSSTSRINNSHPKIKNKDLPPGFVDVDVNVQTLDWFVATSGIVPDIIKIDIEGAEYSLLRGGLETLQTYHPILFIELHSEFCALQCSVVLQELGYKILFLKEELDNRIMIKGVPGSQTDKKEQPASFNKYLDVISSQYEVVRQIQGFYNKELSEYYALRAESRALKAKYLELQSMDATTKSEIQDMQQELRVLHTEHDTLQSKSQHMQEELTRLQAEHDAVMSDFQTLQTNHRALSDEYELSKLEFQTLQTNHQALLGEHELSKSDFQTLQTNHQSLLDEHELSKSEFQILQTKHQTLLNEHESLKSEFATLFTDQQKIVTEHESLKSDYRDLQVKSGELMSQIQGAQAELTSLLETRSIRYIKKIKSVLVKIGIRKTY
jgi:FkbM family methyltransferase